MNELFPNYILNTNCVEVDDGQVIRGCDQDGQTINSLSTENSNSCQSICDKDSDCNAVIYYSKARPDGVNCFTIKGAPNPYPKLGSTIYTKGNPFNLFNISFDYPNSAQEYFVVLPGPNVSLSISSIEWGNNYTSNSYYPNANNLIENWRKWNNYKDVGENAGDPGYLFGTEYWGGIIYVSNINVYLNVRNKISGHTYLAHIYYDGGKFITGEARTYAENYQIFDSFSGEYVCRPGPLGDPICTTLNKSKLPGVIILGMSNPSSVPS
jgi:hypothetical protein